VWGIEDVERNGSALQDPFSVDSAGTALYIDAFDPSSGEQLEFIYNVLDQTLANTELVTEQPDNLLIDFRTWYSFYAGQPFDPYTAAAGFPALLQFYCISENSYFSEVGYSSRDHSKIVYLTATVKTNMTNSIGTRDGLEYTNLGQFWIEQIHDMSPTVAPTLRQVSDVWVRILTEQAAVRSVITGVAAATCTSFAAILLFTGNWLISFLVLLTLACTVCTTIGLFWVFGWDFGIVEAICAVILIGISEDYVFHLAESYVISDPSLSRALRTKAALVGMGFPVLSGAMTTIVSSLLLLACYTLVFVKFGVILVVNTTLSVAFALLFFPALCALIGPQNKRGQIKLDWLRVVMKGDKVEKVTAAKPAPMTKFELERHRNEESSGEVLEVVDRYGDLADSSSPYASKSSNTDPSIV
jgi:hypothetical protein